MTEAVDRSGSAPSLQHPHWGQQPEQNRSEPAAKARQCDAVGEHDKASWCDAKTT